ncbi:uncharacterized protein LOC112569286 isoform X1 [Pomacea canaliculata]|uniref:uncharacterized protein LOC112569286 isoform X1 n=1 Tax=Pomacea canaliculata TaxID=400727 RepID=UPI000D739F0A|nr:uncharacterized protein LOC112569286 isoform X1 [Pomacea canaliculata]
MEMKMTMGLLLLFAIVVAFIPTVSARSKQNFETGHHLVLEPEHSDLSENQVKAKSDSKQHSREKDAGQGILHDQPPLQGPGQVNTRLPGVDFALYGYNSLKGCPLAPGRDPGFTLPIFSADYSAGHVITDNSYSVPRGVILAPDVSCVTSFTSEVIQTPYDLTKFTSRTVQLDGGDWGPPFAANPVFQKILAELREKVLIVSSVTCSSYLVSLLHLEPPPFHSMFLKWVLRLNNTSDEHLYLEFLDTYGTHFVSQVRLGASLTLVHKMETSNYNRYGQGHVTASANYLSASLLGESETLSSNQKKQADELQSQVETSTVGVGVPPTNSASSLAWLTQVGNNPVAINYVLTPIDLLFSETIVGDWGPLNHDSVDLDKIKTKLITIKKKYCQTLKKKGQLFECEEPTPGLHLSRTRLIGVSIFREFVSGEHCMEECYKLPDCVAVTFCPECDSNDKEYELCQLVQDSRTCSAETNSQWQTTVFLNKIQTLFKVQNTTVADSTSESKNLIVSSSQSCYSSCFDEDKCLAVTVYKSSESTLNCTRHTGPIQSLKEETSADLYFVSLHSKRTSTTRKTKTLIHNDWFMASCISDDGCLQKNAMCFEDRCICRPGFFSSTLDNTCSPTCSTAKLQNSYMEYPESGLRGHNVVLRDPLTLEECKILCVTTSGCLTLDFRAIGGRCLLHNITALDVPLAWYPHSSRGWTHYQRTCMDSLESYPGPLWYNSSCRSDLDCPDPNSQCLLGKCLCPTGFFLDQTDVSCRIIAKESCKEWQRTRAISGVYNITTANMSLKVSCDMNNGGGWLVFQRRRDGSVDFYRNWTDYEQGFGDITGEFWLGLYKIYKLTQGRAHRLRVDLTEVNGERHYAEYSAFSVGGPDTKYRLQVSGYSGNASDSLRVHNNQGFTTHDQNNDNYTTTNCAVSCHGAWWYKSCYHSNLNGRYKSDGAVGSDGIVWSSAHTDNRGFTFSEMKFKAV